MPGLRPLTCLLLGVLSACRATPQLSSVDTQYLRLGEFHSVTSDDRVIRLRASGLEGRTRQVVDDLWTWERVSAKIVEVYTPPPVLPSTDFAVYKLVVVGNQLGAGDSVSIRGYVTTESTRIVIVDIAVHCLPFLTEIRPVEIIRIPRDSRRILFMETTVRHTTCP